MGRSHGRSSCAFVSLNPQQDDQHLCTLVESSTTSLLLPMASTFKSIRSSFSPVSFQAFLPTPATMLSLWGNALTSSLTLVPRESHFLKGWDFPPSSSHVTFPCPFSNICPIPSFFVYHSYPLYYFSPLFYWSIFLFTLFPSTLCFSFFLPAPF